MHNSGKTGFSLLLDAFKENKSTSEKLNKSESDNILKIVNEINFVSNSDSSDGDEIFDVYNTTDEDFETEVLFLSDEDS